MGTTGIGFLMASIVGVAALAAPATLAAQGWNSPRALALAQHATEVRAAQLADSGLRSYRAEARGYLTFLAQLGAGFPEPPKIVRADQIASDLYWRAPSSSKQLIKGRRDTLLLPTDIQYHRDHLGIVQNNFPNLIRIGEGDEIQDVPHPLSAQGLAEYDFALADSLQIILGPRTLNVFQLRFRPKDQNAPRAVGSVYVDRESGAVVRMALGFTRAAFRDKELEDLSVVLENGLIDGRFWLPRRQEIEIRRTGTWLDYPARGIIRGRWEISDYDVNVPVDAVFNAGPEIQAAPGSLITRHGEVSTPGFRFPGTVLDSIPPDVQAFASADVAKLQSEARSLVRASALERAHALALAGNGVSQFVHFNRVEGIALGAAATVRPVPHVALTAGASYGFSDHDVKPHGSIAYAWPSGASVAVSGYRRLSDASLVPERSGVINSFAAQDFGSDDTDPYTARGGALSLTLPIMRGVRPSMEIATEEQGGAHVNATPARGRFEPTLAADALRESRATLALEVPRTTLGGFDVLGSASVSGVRDRLKEPSVSTSTYGRATFSADVLRAFGTNQLVLSALGGALTSGSALPAQALIPMGGPVTAPGYEFHQFRGDRAFSARAEWRLKVPFVSVPLGAWGRAPATATLAPYAGSAWISGAGWRPSVGLGALTIFDLLRFDVARGLRDGRWSFNVDVSRDFWPVL